MAAPTAATRGSVLDLAARQALKAGLTLDEARRALCRQMILVTLEEKRGNLVRTARTLQVHRNTLNRHVIVLQLREVVRQSKASGRKKSPAQPKRLDQSRIDRQVA